MAEMLRCREAFSYDDGHGVPVTVPEGALRPADHPDVKGRKSLFESVDSAANRQSTRGNLTPEVATAAPGQARVMSKSGQSAR